MQLVSKNRIGSITKTLVYLNLGLKVKVVSLTCNSTNAIISRIATKVIVGIIIYHQILSGKFVLLITISIKNANRAAIVNKQLARVFEFMC